MFKNKFAQADEDKEVSINEIIKKYRRYKSKKNKNNIEQ